MGLMVVLISVLAFANGEYARYDNYKVYRLTVNNEELLHKIWDLPQTGYDIWSALKVTENTVDIMVKPDRLREFDQFLSADNILHKIIIQDVQKVMDLTPRIEKQSKAIDWVDYHPLDHIHAWLDELEVLYPGVTTFDIGKSYNNVSIKGVKLAFNSSATNIAVIESGIHANEWIAPATITYIINEFITSQDPRVRNVADSIIWYIVPSVNPDGYLYSFSDDRMWRKNRQPNSGSICVGTDLNRNWDWQWNTGGASDDPCNYKYAGPSSASSVEVQALQNWISSFGSDLKVYLNFHSYSQMLMCPYGYTTEHLDNYQEMYEVAEKSVQALTAVHGTPFTYGNIAETIYVASGNSIDWVKGVTRTRLAYTYGLRDLGDYGFLLPPDQILPTAEETLVSVLVIGEESIRLEATK